MNDRARAERGVRNGRLTGTEIDDALSAIGFDEENDSWVSAVREAEAPLPSGCIGPYELIEEIDRGGQAVVYKARQPGTNRTIAIKRLRAGAFASASMRRRFDREIETLALLDHVNIVTAFAMEMVDGVPILAMRWIDGVPITHWAGGGGGSARRPVGEILALFIRVCEAVGHAHQRGVIHRDLKPSNILVDASHEPKVLDFGLAKFITAADADDASGMESQQFVGTICYAAPEQLRGSQRAVDVRSDVYSLGAILYEALTGRRPFEPAESPLDTLAVIEGSDPLPPAELNSSVNRDLEAVLLKALAKDQSQRYQSVDAFGTDLRCCQDGEPVSAAAPTAVRQLLRSLKRHRVAAAFAATVFTLVAGCAVIALVLANRLAEQRDVAQQAGTDEAAARSLAEIESAKSLAVTGFLQRMLSSADPMQGGQSELTVKQVLDSASIQIDSGQIGAGSIDQPEVEAAVRLVIGVTYHSLGDYRAAESHLQRALKLSHVLTPRDPVLIAAITNELGHLKTSNGEYDAAEPLLREALTQRRTLLGGEHPDVAVSLNNLAKVLVLMGRFEESEPLWRESLAIRLNHFGREHPLVGSSLLNLGATRHRLGEPAEAESLLSESLEIFRRTQGEDHVDVGFALRNLGIIQLERGDLRLAEQTLRRALEIKQKAIGEQHPAVGFVFAALGQTLLAQSRHAEAREMFEHALEIYRAVMPGDHPRIAAALIGVARSHLAEGDLLRARQILLEVQVMHAAALSPDHPDVADAGAAMEALERESAGAASSNGQ